MFESKRGRELIDNLTRLANYFILSVVWFFFSIPIITIGAATSALYATQYHCVEEGYGNILPTFWKYFRNSFKQATIIWSAYLVILLIMRLNRFLIDNQLYTSWMNSYSQVFLLLFVILTLPCLLISLCYIARFKDSLKVILLNSTALAVSYGKVSLLLSGLVLFSGLMIWLIPLAVVYIPGFLIRIICRKIEAIFIRYQSSSIRK